MHGHLRLLTLASEALASETASGARWLDLLGIGLVLLFLALGALRGLWWQLVRLLGVVASFSVARAIAPRITPMLQATLPGLDPRIASGLAWLLVLIGCMIAVAMIARVGRATIDAAELRAVDRVGGAVAGGASGLLVHVAILVCILQVSTRAFAETALRGTHSQGLIEALGRKFPILLDAHAADALSSLRGGVDVDGDMAPTSEPRSP